MSIQEEPYYWLVCDHPKCGRKSTEGGEHTAWAEVHMAVEEAFNSEWTITSDEKHFCGLHHPEEEEDG